VTVAVEATSLLGRPTGIGAFARQVIGRLMVDPSVALVPFALTWRGRNRLDDALDDLPRGGGPASPGDTSGPTGPGAPSPSGPLHRRPAAPGSLPRPRARHLPGQAGRLGVPLAARPLRAVWRRFDLPPIEWWTGPVDVVWGPNFVVPPARRAASVVSVHDLTPLRFPELCQADTLAYPALVRRAVERGAIVQTDSDAVAGEVRDWLGLPAERVVSVPLGVDPRATADGDPAAGRRLAGADRYVLALGTVEPRKDLPTVVAAFDQAAASSADLALVVAGPDGWGVEAFDAAVAAARHRARIHRLGWVDDAARADLLAGARCLAFPSVYEGFGLPPLEAMAAGVPVVCSDLPVLAEVTGDAARLVPTRDPEALAAALVDLDGDEEARAELVQRGRARVAQFTWERCAAGMADLLRRAAAGSF
jgi:glycosyltransferase involved in cell wall biosynthesis